MSEKLDGIGPNEMREIRKGLALCQEYREQLQRGEACGVECQELKRECEEMFEFLTRVNRVHGPRFPGKAV